MAKHTDIQGHVLFPDFDALAGAFQVLKNRDITREKTDFAQKKGRLIWRGATTRKERITLCEISKQNADLVDAKFTYFCQGAEKQPELQIYKGPRVSYEEMLEHKYLLWIDGNAGSYSRSGWRFFADSVTLKPDSDVIQWYYRDLKPYEHYVPVERDLSNLTEQIQWLETEPEKAAEIAKNARQYGTDHLLVRESLRYFYHLLKAYSALEFVP